MDRQKFTQGKGCNNRKLSDEERAEIVRLYTTPLPDGSWMGVTTIARRFGVAHNCIQYHLRRAGVRTRTPQQSNIGKRCKPIVNLPTGEAPDCKCGCGCPTTWNRRKNRWNRYLAGHYTQRLQQNPSWLGGRSWEPYALGWPMMSKAIRERDGHTCRRCGETKRLHVHHIDTDKLNNDPMNLITLCNSCHSRVHWELARRGGDAVYDV